MLERKINNHANIPIGQKDYKKSTLEATSSSQSQISVGPDFCLFGCGLEGFWFKL